MSQGTTPPSGNDPANLVPHYKLAGFPSDVSPFQAAGGSLVGMIGEWLEQDIQSLLQQLVGITGDLGQVSVIIDDLSYLMQMLDNLSDPSFVVPSNYGNEIISQVNLCISAVNALQGSPGSEIDQIKSALIADLDDVKDLFEICPFTDAFESLGTDLQGVLNCLWDMINDTNSYYSDHKGAIASSFENYYWALQTDINNLNAMVSNLQDQFGSVPTAIQALDNAVNTFWSDLNGIEVSGKGFHNTDTSLYDEMHGNGSVGDPISWYFDDLNKACNGDKHYSESGATTAYNEGESVLNTDLPAAELATLPPNELVEVLHEALTTPLGSSTIYQQELQTLMDAYYQATTSVQKALDTVYQSGSTNLVIAVSSILDMLKATLMWAKKEASTGLNVIASDIQEIRKIK